MKRRVAALFLAATLAAPAFAQTGPPASRDAAPPAESPDAEAYWRARAGEARARVTTAEERVALAEEEYGKMRHRNRKRGEPRATLGDSRTAAYAELEAALRYRDQDLPEEARRAGALPGWLRN